MTLDAKTIEECKVHISNGDTEKAIHILINHIGKSDKSVILLSSRWNTLLRNKVDGVISNDEYSINKSILDDSLLTILENLDPEANAENEKKNTLSKSDNKNKIVYLLAGVLIATTCIGIVLWGLLNQNKYNVASQDNSKLHPQNESKINAPQENVPQEKGEPAAPLNSNPNPKNKAAGKSPTQDKTKWFYINADSYNNYQDALKFKKLIFEKLGYTTKVKEVHLNGNTFYRIVLDKTTTNEEEGKTILDKLRKEKLAESPWLEDS